MIETKLIRVASADDPHRCQAVAGAGQCPYRAVECGKFCLMHGGGKQVRENQKKIMDMYNLAIWHGRVKELADHTEVKTLRAEIGILRMLLENVLTQCKTGTELLFFSAKISDLVGRIEKVVTSCNRIEASSGMLLDKSAALHLAAQMVDIIGAHVDDAEAVNAISQQIGQ